MIAKITGQYPKNISIYYRIGQLKGKRSNGSSCVRTNSRQIEELLIGGRKFSLVGFANYSGGCQQISTSAIIPQSFPKFKNVGILSSSQSINGGIGFYYSEIIFHTLRNPCLL